MTLCSKVHCQKFFKLKSVSCKIEGFVLSVSGLGFWPEDLGNKSRGWVQGVTVKNFETRGLDFKVEGLGFWAWGLGFRVWTLKILSHPGP